MTEFLDGPAAGVTLALERQPIYLRVVLNRRTREWDALDQISDTPKANESLYAYRREWIGLPVHIQFSGKRGRRCGWFRPAKYRFVAEQPSEEVMRDAARWQQWAKAMAEESNPTAPSTTPTPTAEDDAPASRAELFPEPPSRPSNSYMEGR